MWSLKVWGQGSGAPAYRQVVQGPTGTHIGEGCEARITNIVVAERQNLEGWECPVPNCGGKSGDPRVADLVRVEREHLHISHQTERLSQ